MTGGSMILVGGGARSGKSRFALQLAIELGVRRVFVATAEPLDAEMALRIARHRTERAPSAFVTIEEPVTLAESLEQVWQLAEPEDRGPSLEDHGADARNPSGPAPPDVVVVDCLTLWVANLLVRGASEAELSGRFERLRQTLRRRRSHVILVSNEVGMGLVPETPLGRIFRDVVGGLHQRLASDADQLHVAIMGGILRVHPGPVEWLRFGGVSEAHHGSHGSDGSDG